MKVLEGFKTYSGLLVAAIGLVLSLLKVNLTNEDIQPIVDALIIAAGLIVAAYGRAVTKANIPKSPEIE